MIVPAAAVFRHLVFLLTLLALTQVAVAGGLYTGEVPVATQADAERTEALKGALAQVIVRLSGDSAALTKPEVAKAVANAERYVQQYQYAQETVSEGGQAQTRLTLQAQFDREAVDQLLHDLGLARAGGDASAPALIDAKPQTFRLWVSGVRSAESYARLVGTLSRNELVRGVQAQQARGDGVELRVDVIGPLQRLLDSLAGGPLRVTNAKPPVEGIDALLDMQ
jgi:hypothetical protein